MSGFNHIIIKVDALEVIDQGPIDITNQIDFNICLNKKPIYLTTESDLVDSTIIMSRMKNESDGLVVYSGQFGIEGIVSYALTFNLKNKQVVLETSIYGVD